MNKRFVWAAFILFALCLVGTVAYRLWSDNDLWSYAFGALAVIIIVPVILWPAVQSVRENFTMEDRPPGGDPKQ